MKLYRRVAPDEADRTLRLGFEDHRGSYLTNCEWLGVFVSDRPLDSNDFGDTSATVLLEIDLALPESAIADYEWIEEGKSYREWLIPAPLLNANAKIRVVSDEKIDE